MAKKFTYYSSALGYDPDALALFNAIIADGGSLTLTEKTAANTFIIADKANGTWTKRLALYLMIGGSATSHKYNAKDPRDLDAAFRLTFSGGWIHSVNGALPNGTNAYADSHLIPNTHLTNISGHLGYYSRTDSLSGYDMGSANDTSTITYPVALIIRYTTGRSFAVWAQPTNYGLSVAQADGRGLFYNSRISATDLKIYKNGSSIGSSATNSSTAPISSTYSIYIGAINAVGARLYSNKECALSSIGTGFSSVEETQDYINVQAFQTTLGRQV